MSDNIAIKVDGIHKDFKLPHQKVNSIKTVFTGLHKKKVKTFETQHALKNISFEVKKGEFFGIVGRNGSGKSTLLKIIAEIYQPTRGTLSKNGKLVPFIELGVGFNPDLTGRENVYLNGALLGFTQKEIDDHYDDIVSFAELELFMDQKLKNYSSGMQVRLAFAVATRAEADILLVDEVLAVGDSDFQKKCFNYFKEVKRGDTTVIFVTHDMNAVREYCDRAMLINNNEIQLIGVPDKVAVAYGKLFSTNSEQRSKGSDPKGERWGSQEMKFTAVKVPKRLAGEAKSLTIGIEAKARTLCEGVIVGFSVRNQAGVTVLGTNSKLLHQRLKRYEKNDKLSGEWEVPNIFNTGKYTVDVALVDENGVDVLDWWEAATSFVVDKDIGNPYIVCPDIKLQVG